MNTQTQEALKMAIEWVEGWKGIAPSKIELLRVLREALAQPAQEPVAWIDEFGNCEFTYAMWMKEEPNVTWIPVYTHPAPSWQGLSDDEKLAIIRKWKDAHTMREQELIGLGDAIEQALKEKNT